MNPTPAPEIPQPPVKPVIGNLGELEAKSPIQSMMRLARIYGPIYKLTLLGYDIHVISSQALVDELCDQERFEKRLHGSLKEIRAFAGDGLFTAYNDEPNWGKAHRLLMPALGPIGIRSMFDRMLDIADQMFVKWERLGPSSVIDVADNMTRLTLDTIALCAFDYRFNSFYQNEMHPFVAAMVDALEEAGQRTRRPGVVSNLMLPKRRRYEADQEVLKEVADELIRERRMDPKGAAKQDLLNVMLHGVDTVTGEKLSDENIRFQLVTFLIAGHETTSGLLSFAVYLLLSHPEVLLKAQRIVDEVLGEVPPKIEQLAQLRYIEQILMETLRLWPTAPAFGLRPKADTMLAGRYPVTTRDLLLVLEPMLHRDPLAWGEDAEAFRPERFAPESAEKLPPNSWKPFGNGVRACIGRPFAMQEAQLVLAMLLQRFDLVFDDPSYQLEVAETLTLKPHNLRIRAKVRGGGGFRLRSEIGHPIQKLTSAEGPEAAPFDPNAQPLYILYGSNAGSSEMFARRIATDAPRQGYAPTLATLDEYAGALSVDVPTVIVTSSYEGQPPDNAKLFLAWLADLPPQSLKGLRYTVFGCGSLQWARTYQQVPKAVDTRLAKAGAVAFYRRGETDASGDFFGGFDDWYGALWDELGSVLKRQAVEKPAAPDFEVDILEKGRQKDLQLTELDQALVIANRELVVQTGGMARSKRHIELRLPNEMRYRTGDYLAILPRNPAAVADRALRRFALAIDAQLVIRSTTTAAASLPTGYPISARTLLLGYFELAQPATRAQLKQLAAVTGERAEREELERLSEPGAYEEAVLAKRWSVLDLIVRARSCSIPFAQFLAMLPLLRPRQYSISSSPMIDEEIATLTVAVVDAEALSGQGRYQGVASTFLASLQPGDRLPVVVRPSQAAFRPPEDPRVPMVMVCAGTGIAPFRGFLQERSAQRSAGREVAKSLLFFGMDHPDVDFLYRDEMERWEIEGVVEVRTAFSAKPEGDVSFVQHRIWEDRDEVARYFREGAQFYVCGDGKYMAPAVRETFIRIYQTTMEVSEDMARRWADRMEHEHGRYVADVFL